MKSSSLTSSSSSLSNLSSSEISGFGILPVATLKSKIVEKIQENRVTLLVGEIGCVNDDYGEDDSPTTMMMMIKSDTMTSSPKNLKALKGSSSKLNNDGERSEKNPIEGYCSHSVIYSGVFCYEVHGVHAPRSCGFCACSS
ncbi:hypothetical protein T459_15687 [Capsicum annuum]|uniref:Uncharacterized protein n=1 Tax=Capsicum annuum TaxID=4072 RepID=A0A2G2Z6Z8_CAPAN|nr:hypothetical protein T459_15687 [Capsicum annuum]